MNLVRCVVVDDNELDRLTISGYLSHFPEIELVGMYETPKKALEVFSVTNVDIVFLDIDMPDMSGLELRKQILDIPVCIFTTDHSGYALDSFDLETLDYLLKPYSFERFAKTINRINEYIQIREKANKFNLQEENGVFFVKEGHQKVKVVVDKVLYLNAMQNYTAIVTKDQKQYLLSPLSTLLKEKYFNSFVQIHRSYAVNKKYIQVLGTKEVTLSTGEQLPVGRSYKNNIKTIDL
jgi:two-component system LytT family response regulator